ncbi:MAG: ProQ/FinO family protein, partial [Solirubrobacteraceae bacterium]|nr:ProQ/FinO family protein [Solirubrobacteraceae bacterium]
MSETTPLPTTEEEIRPAPDAAAPPGEAPNAEKAVAAVADAAADAPSTGEVGSAPEADEATAVDAHEDGAAADGPDVDGAAAAAVNTDEGAPTTAPDASAASGDAAPAPAAAPKAAPLSPAEVAQQLKQAFPALFAGAPKPLKLRIQVDIQEREPGKFSKQALSAFFRRHTGATSYLIAVTKAPHRFDLDGQPAGEITDEHRQVANDELARRRGNHEERRQAEVAQRQLEEQQRRNRAGLLHDFQNTTLTKANFCALKGVPVDELEGLLEVARGEAAERARHAPPPAFDRPRRPEGPPQRRAEGPRGGGAGGGGAGGGHRGNGGNNAGDGGNGG